MQSRRAAEVLQGSEVVLWGGGMHEQAGGNKRRRRIPGYKATMLQARKRETRRGEEGAENEGERPGLTDASGGGE